MDPYALLLKKLLDNDVEFVVIGGYALVLHGAHLTTFDVDICSTLSGTNLERIIRALDGLDPVLRTHPARVPLPTDPAKLHGLRNLYLRTSLAPIDILGEVPGVGDYAVVRQHAVVLPFQGKQLVVLDVDTLIVAKTAAGRDKDKIGLNQLLALRARRGSE